jgi:hypothetical protein
MINSKILQILLLVLFTLAGAHSQSVNDINQKNSERIRIQSSHIRSMSIIEYQYVKGSESILADSGFKSFYYAYDELGRMTEYKKYHVYPDLTLKELYQYGKNDKISVNTRYNSKGDRIETITYKYSSSGRLKSQVHEAYYNSVRTGVYFSILANINELELFETLQHELEIDPVLESYTIIVNIVDPEELNQYVVIGDESDAGSMRFSWSQLSMESQRGLLAYTGPNRKERSFTSKFIDRVLYKYDNSGNITSREVHNTSGDVINKETYRYGSGGKVTAYNKYNDDGKISGGEIYNYDGSGRLIESIGTEPGGKLSGRLLFKYDESGNLTQKTWQNSLGETSTRYVYFYDNEKRVTEELKYRAENEIENRFAYKYDEKGNVESMIKYNINDEKEKIYRYLYETY